jgi:hypothetical protein
MSYIFRLNAGEIQLDVQSDQAEILFHILLPKDAEANSVSAGGNDTDFQNTVVQDSPYVDFSSVVSGNVSFKIQLQKTRRNR